MPESNELLSAGAQLIGMPLAGPESFSEQQLTYLKKSLDVDETVLWANAAGSTVNTSLSITLSEAFTNFERVRIVFARPTLPVSTEYMTSGNSNTVMVLESVIVGSNNAVVFDVATLNLSGTTVTCTGFTRKTLADTTLSTSQSYPMTIYKIVGIKRIAGGN